MLLTGTSQYESRLSHAEYDCLVLLGSQCAAGDVGIPQLMDEVVAALGYQPDDAEYIAWKSYSDAISSYWEEQAELPTAVAPLVSQTSYLQVLIIHVYHPVSLLQAHRYSLTS